jgi:bifunctional DNA-binding transcriptional regulator/antitoxin component of YhaV-PrlF toxin-antitoxin module
MGRSCSAPPAGRFHVDSRGNVFLPAATRTVLGVHSGDRIVLVASPRTRTLLIYPVAVVASLLANLYRESAAGHTHDR